MRRALNLRNTVFMLIMAFAIVSAGAATFAESGTAGGKTIAYYFHGAFRCVTCTNMENYAKEAIDSNFKDDLRSGKLEFKEVDVESPGNEHYVKDYQLYTKTLILSYIKDGKEIRSKNLDKIWEYARDRKKFTGYVEEEVRKFMEESK